VNCVNIREIQDLLGHKHVETTMIYTHVLRDVLSVPKSPLIVFIRLRRRPRLRAEPPKCIKRCCERRHSGVQARSMAVDAVGHSLWRRTMNSKRITLRSLVRRRVCFGGFRRRTWRYHGLCPWGSTLRNLFNHNSDQILRVYLFPYVFFKEFQISTFATQLPGNYHLNVISR
jgi:hypothetical protein